MTPFLVQFVLAAIVDIRILNGLRILGIKELNIFISCFLTPGIIPSSFISYIVPDGRFSAADISSDTQVVVMDEWTPDSLSCEDAKRILQGGLC